MKITLKRGACAAAFPVLLAPPVGLSQSAVTLPEVVVRGEGIVSGNLSLEEPSGTGSRLGLKIREIPASVEVIPGEIVRQRGDVTTQAAVTRATGVASAATPGNGSTALSARGFAGHSSVMQLYDGTRLYVGAGTVTFPVDTWPMERIEVLRGPASVLYGEGAIGAAINYVPKKPNRSRFEHEALVSAGNWQGYRAAFGSTGPLGPAAAYRLDVAGTTSDGYVDRSDSNQLVFSASVLFDVTRDLAVTLAFDGAHQDAPRYWGTPRINGVIDPAIRRTNFNVLDSVISYQDYWTRLKAEWRVSPSVALRNELYHLTTDRHWRNLENYTFQPGTGLIRRTGYLEIFHDQKQVGNRLDATFDGTLFGRRNRFLAGFDVNRIDFKHTNNGPFGGQSDVDPFTFDPGLFVNLAGTTPRFQTRTRQVSLFAEDALDVTDRLKLVAGVRNESVDFHRKDLAAGTAFDKKLSALVGRVGGVYAVTPGLSVYGQYGTGIDPLGSLITTSAAQAAFDLTTGRQVEVGLKQSLLGGRAEWTLAAYQIVKKKLLSRDPANPTVSQQIGQQSSRGVEASLGLQPARGWSVDANIALIDAKFDDFNEQVGPALVSRAGNLPPNVPQKVANLWVTRNFAGAWEAGAGARYVDKRYADNANTITVPGYTVADAFLSYRLRRDSALTLRARNLFDRLYAIAPYNSGTQFILGDPRSFEVALTAKF
jgi:iron complex outermembrane receptor protein